MFDKLVYGVGVNDCPGWASDKNKQSYCWRVYDLWRQMIRRCYSAKFHQSNPTYKGCIVCSRWLTLSKFAEDIKTLPGYDLWLNNPGKRITLDKDMRVRGNKEYSIDSCQFVTDVQSSLDVQINHPGRTRHPDVIKQRAFSRGSKIIAIEVSSGESKLFNSLTEAAKELGVFHSNISSVLRGKISQTGGFKFELVREG